MKSQKRGTISNTQDCFFKSLSVESSSSSSPRAEVFPVLKQKTQSASEKFVLASSKNSPKQLVSVLRQELVKCGAERRTRPPIRSDPPFSVSVVPA